MFVAEICLAMAIYFEARSEPMAGQAAVAQVIMNRVADKRWPDSVCAVVKQRWQFSFYWDGLPERITEWDAYYTAEYIAEEALNGTLPNEIGKSCYYHTVKIMPRWTKNLQFTRVIDSHVFWEDKLKSF